ncbi:MAG TPA: choice-of-anchor V domain-containing protein [Longimicrobium sp.]|nr:choice-of-anchor V domain-containing protein [Longimicrobium sp.]
MKLSNLTTIAGVVGAVLVLVLPSAGRGGAYPDRPPPAHTGGFGEPTCAQCHFGSPPNAPGGRLAVDGVPDAYRPGERYRLTVRVEKPELGGGGFQLSARSADGAQAGSLRAVDGRAQVVAGRGGVQYAGHTEEGVASGGEARMAWEVEWTAPERASGPIVVHAAANASNGDASSLGDFVYTLELTSRAGPR